MDSSSELKPSSSDSAMSLVVTSSQKQTICLQPVFGACAGTAPAAAAEPAAAPTTRMPSGSESGT